MSQAASQDNATSPTFDLTERAGLHALVRRAYEDAAFALGDGDDPEYLDEITGSEARFADAWTRVFLEQSISLPRDAFGDPARAGRELRIIGQLYRYFFHQAVCEAIQRHQETRRKRRRK